MIGTFPSSSPNPSRLGLILAIMLLLLPAASAAFADNYKVMSFNIREGNADDGQNSWDYRKDLVVRTIATFNPDFFGVQESLAYQSNYLLNNLSGYTRIGTGRDAGGSGEQSAIFYKTSEFTQVRSGQFWLSPTPTKAGSIGWDAKFPRIVTWVELQDKSNPDFSFVYFNTHWDNAGATARMNSASLMRRQIQIIAPDLPVVITGDFNADTATDPYRRLMGGDGYDTGRLFQDTYRRIHPEDQASAVTNPGFDGKGGSKRIDWILADQDWTVLDASIVKTSYNGRYPSDHFAVTATISPISLPEPTSLTLLLTTTASLLTPRPRRR